MRRAKNAVSIKAFQLQCVRGEWERIVRWINHLFSLYFTRTVLICEWASNVHHCIMCVQSSMCGMPKKQIHSVPSGDIWDKKVDRGRKCMLELSQGLFYRNNFSINHKKKNKQESNHTENVLANFIEGGLAMCVTNHYLAIVYYTPAVNWEMSHTYFDKGSISQFYYSNKFHFLSFSYTFAIESQWLLSIMNARCH